MALVKCRECGGEVSTAAAACPKCGAKPASSISARSVLGVLFIGFLMYRCTLRSESDEPAKPAPLSADPVQAAKAAEYATAAALKKEIAFRRVVMMLTELKRAQRDPDSLVWEDISAKADASVMCIRYRSRNGFGGMNKGMLVVANKKASDKSAAWNKHCAGHGKELEQFDYAANAIK